MLAQAHLSGASVGVAHVRKYRKVYTIVNVARKSVPIAFRITIVMKMR